MKLSRSLMMGLAAAGLVVLLSSVSFADEGMGKDKVKLLNESALALQQSNPDLSAALTKYATEEANEVKDEKGEKEEKGEKIEEKSEKNELKTEIKELEGKAEQEKMTEREAHIKLLKDSAAALSKSNPELAERLTKMADKSAKWMEKKEGKKDKEEVGEKEENEKINKK
ncbi:MAG: hypothetical protein HQL26_10965 [Candidatus Omnitrophica bacterium]|nr:hypothetical protein [Candidatus Omnitrophota bacterium]